MKKPIIIVAGEPYSVFLEIFFKTYKKVKLTNPILLVVSKKLFLAQMRKLNYNYKLNFINRKNFNIKEIKKSKINIIDVSFSFKKAFDKISKKSKKYINECFLIAIEIAKKYKIKFFINGPISKKHFLEKNSLGVTEYLAQKTKNVNNETMLIYTDKLSVCPITTHDPLKKIFKKITKENIIKKILVINKFYKDFFNRDISYAITGINPHCESKDKNNEEKKIIMPAIKILKKKKIKIKGPLPADTIFLKQNLKKYDVIIGMYHDQVLTPIKTIYGFEAINITLGLPFIRISPDHGPNHQMLGRNKSSPNSLIQAFKFINKYSKI